MPQSTYCHYDTPRKARLKGAADYLKYNGIPFHHSDLFQYFGVSKTRGWAILQQDSQLFDRRFRHNEGVSETRGRQTLLSAKDLDRCDRFLQDLGWTARTMT